MKLIRLVYFLLIILAFIPNLSRAELGPLDIYKKQLFRQAVERAFKKDCLPKLESACLEEAKLKAEIYLERVLYEGN